MRERIGGGEREGEGRRGGEREGVRERGREREREGERKRLCNHYTRDLLSSHINTSIHSAL